MSMSKKIKGWGTVLDIKRLKIEQVHETGQTLIKSCMGSGDGLMRGHLGILEKSKYGLNVR